MLGLQFNTGPRAGITFFVLNFWIKFLDNIFPHLTLLFVSLFIEFVVGKVLAFKIFFYDFLTAFTDCHHQISVTLSNTIHDQYLSEDLLNYSPNLKTIKFVFAEQYSSIPANSLWNYLEVV